MDLEIRGRHALLFDDDANCSFVNSAAALVPWNGEESVLIDRHDVRHLLDRIPSRLKRLRFVEETGGVSQSELDSERYLDLPVDEGELVSETIERSETTGSGAYQAVPFSYSHGDGSAGSDSVGSGQNHIGFRPPFTVPTSLFNNLPPTEKLHQIMARTALFVNEHGGQSEIVLRVKQGDNPTFGFLMPDNQLHPYFRFLVDHPQLLRADSTLEEEKSSVQNSESLVNEGGALSLLGSMYGTGEDDDNAPQQESEVEPNKLNNDGNLLYSHKSGKEEPSTSLSLEDKAPIKRSAAATIKETTFLPKKNHFLSAAPISKKLEGAASQQGVVGRTSSQPLKADDKLPVLEPPSFLKRSIDKIVEFIHRNGTEFEAVLIEQDMTAGRFPFLLPSNLYHPYYLKVLEEANESKLLGKNSFDESKRRDRRSPATDEQSEGWSFNPQRKEKFKMTIGSKKDSPDQQSKPTRQSGVTADEAAAIVLAATRGRSPANAIQSTSAADSERARASSFVSSEEVAAIILAATRGLSPSTTCQSTGSPVISLPQTEKSISIAKTVALAASGEADSSEALLTKEQKVKAERLKRAKMFAAMIKSGVNPISEPTPSVTTLDGIRGPVAAVASREEREGSSVPFDGEVASKEKCYRKKRHSSLKDHEEVLDDDHNTHPKRSKISKHHHSRHKHRDELEAEDCHHHRHQHRKQLSDSEGEDKKEKSSRHRSKQLSDSEGEDKKEKSSRHRSKQLRDSEDEDKKDKSSRHRHDHYRNHDSSSENEERKGRHRRHHHHRRYDPSEEDREGHHKHRRKHRSRSEKREGEDSERSLKCADGAADHGDEVSTAAVLESKPSDASTDIPSDLRAKIRAMLLETM